MIVKNLTIFLPLLLAACGRQPEVRTYTEVIQVAPSTAAAPAAPAPQAQGGLPEGHPPLAAPGAPSMGGMQGREGEVPPPPASSDLAWTTPAGWVEQPGSGMRLAAFSVSGPEGEALCTLIVLGGMAGSTEANVNRWRRQLGLPETFSGTLPPLASAIPGGLVDLIDEARTAGLPTAVLGSLHDLPNRTVFLKLTGPPALLETQRAAFLSLANSLRLIGDTP